MDDSIVLSHCNHTHCQISLFSSLAFNYHTFLRVDPYEPLHKRDLALYIMFLPMLFDDKVEVRVQEGSPRIDLFE